MKPFRVGEWVTWTLRNHGKPKRYKGRIIEIRGTLAAIDTGTPDLKAVQTFRLNRARGRKQEGV